MNIYIFDTNKKVSFNSKNIEIHGVQIETIIDNPHMQSMFGTYLDNPNLECDRMLAKKDLHAALQLVKNIVDVYIRLLLVSNGDYQLKEQCQAILDRAKSIHKPLSIKWSEYIHASFDVIMKSNQPFVVKQVEDIGVLMDFFSLTFDNTSSSFTSYIQDNILSNHNGVATKTRQFWCEPHSLAS